MRGKFIIAAFMLFSFPLLAQEKFPSPVGEGNEPVAAGKFKLYDSYESQNYSKYKLVGLQDGSIHALSMIF